MPEVHFIGTIELASGIECSPVSITWAIIPGSEGWTHHKGQFFGETQISELTIDTKAIFNHPIDVQFNTSTYEGWPYFVCEIWNQSHEGIRRLAGCGCTWLPTKGASNKIQITLWKPCESGSTIQRLSDYLLPGFVDVNHLRNIAMNPSVRSQYETYYVGTLTINVNTLCTADFKSNGVFL